MTDVGAHAVCAVCLDLLVDPRLLPCLHSFCRSCLDRLGLTGDGLVSCPVCRHPCQLPTGHGAASLPVDFLSRQRVLEVSVRRGNLESVVCTACDPDVRQPVVAKCVNCHQVLCQPHANAHPYNPGSKSHTVKRLGLSSPSAEGKDRRTDSGFLSPSEPRSNVHNTEEQDAADDNSRPVMFEMCSVHRKEEEPLRLYCKPCDMFICFECFVEDHVSHECVSAKHIVSKQRAKIYATMRALREETIPEIDEAMRTVSDVTQNLEVRAVEVRKEINDAMDKIMTQLTNYHRICLQQVDDIEESRSKILDAQFEELGSHLKSVHSALGFSERALEHCEGVELLPVCNTLRERLDDLRRSRIERTPRESACLVFKRPSSLVKVEGLFGTLAGSETSAAHSHMEGTGEFRALPNKRMTMTLIARGTDNNRVYVGGDRIGTSWTDLPEAVENPPRMDVTDNRDGTYTLACILKINGIYGLNVEVNGQSIPVSPLNIECAPWAFDARRCHENIQLLCGCLQATKIRGSMNNDYITGNVGLKHGFHEWKVHMKCVPYWIVLGVTRKPVFDPKSSWGWSSVARQLPDGLSLDPDHEHWQENDTIVLELNCDEHRLRMKNLRSGTVNEICNLPNVELFPWFILYKQHDSITIET